MTNKEEMDDFDKLLQDFIDSELKEVENAEAAKKQVQQEAIDTIEDEVEMRIEPRKMPAINPALADEEKALIKAWISYTQATIEVAQKYNKTTIPVFRVMQESLLPRYKPNVIENFTYDTLLGWVVLLETYPNQVSKIHPNSSDEQILAVAENTSDPILQDALISYVEILIELEACDLAYQTRLISAKKKFLTKQVNEDHNIRRERIQKYIEAVEKKKLPVNAHNLILNYFKVAAKDPEGAWETLVTNPAVFSPIELDRIPDSWFRSKPKPEDGFKWNKKIANFLKKLKI